jgi:hypothetical protein
VDDSSPTAFLFLECADLSALWSAATCRSQRTLRPRWRSGVEPPADQSGDRSPHSKSLANDGSHELMQISAGRAGEEGDGVFENGRDDNETFLDSFG